MSPTNEPSTSIADERRGFCRHGLEQHGKGAGILQSEHVVEQALGGRERLSLHAIAAELPERLRREPNVAHHRYARIGDRADAWSDAWRVDRA